MKHKIEELTLDEVNILALALDYFLCNYDHNTTTREIVEDLFMHVDFIAEEAEAVEDSERLVEKTDNLLVVDFRPKNG